MPNAATRMHTIIETINTALTTERAKFIASFAVAKSSKSSSPLAIASYSICLKASPPKIPFITPRATTPVNSKNVITAVIIVVTVIPVRLFVIGSCLYLEQRTSTIIESAISTNLHISFDEFILYVRSKYRICCQIRCTYHSLYTAMRYFRL